MFLQMVVTVICMMLNSSWRLSTRIDELQCSAPGCVEGRLSNSNLHSEEVREHVAVEHHCRRKQRYCTSRFDSVHQCSETALQLPKRWQRLPSKLL
mmetsp:Transcript_68337/g.160686  ORF Transcript_68337/g.160686 Transcript_68337/m.160686 type:complete len:96 (+) Transcript_68337:205-492(+)